MEKNIHICFVYIIEGYIAAGNIDTYFYSHLPNVKTQVVDTYTGCPITDIPPVEQTVTVTGSTFASSTLLAGIIKEYLQGKSRKIKISIAGTDKHIEYEGPNLEVKVAEIRAMIDRLVDENGESRLEIKSSYQHH